MCLCAFRLTNQKRVCPRALATQPIKSYFANPILKKEIGGARTRHLCHSVTAWEKPIKFEPKYMKFTWAFSWILTENFVLMRRIIQQNLTQNNLKKIRHIDHTVALCGAGWGGLTLRNPDWLPVMKSDTLKLGFCYCQSISRIEVVLIHAPLSIP